MSLFTPLQWIIFFTFIFFIGTAARFLLSCFPRSRFVLFFFGIGAMLLVPLLALFAHWVAQPKVTGVEGYERERGIKRLMGRKELEQKWQTQLDSPPSWVGEGKQLVRLPLHEAKKLAIPLLQNKPVQRKNRIPSGSLAIP